MSIKTCSLALSAALSLSIFASAPLSADVVTTKNGTKIIGKVVKIHGGEVTVATDFAGDIKIKQAMVTSIATEHAVAVRLASGTRYDGVVSSPAPGVVQVAGAAGTVTTPLAKLAASWPAGQVDPDVAALRRHWTYEADVDVTGESGNHDQLGTAYGFKTKLVGPQDTLQLYTSYNRQKADGDVSADQFKAGVDYADNFAARSSWYARDEAGFDRVMDIAFYDIAAAGMGYDLIKKDDHETLTVRAGLSYRYDDYFDSTTPNLSSPGADFEINHILKVGNSNLTNHIAFVPAFENISNYVITHESAYEVPLASKWWKLKVGVSNDYESIPSAGLKRLDTTYFTRLVLTWGL